MTEAENLMARRFLMCYIVFRNAQRQGAVVNFRLSELSRAVSHEMKTAETVYIYKVWQHKTLGAVRETPRVRVRFTIAGISCYLTWLTIARSGSSSSYPPFLVSWYGYQECCAVGGCFYSPADRRTV